MINYHPTDKQLRQFAEGNISSALALVAAAHCDVCSKCQAKVDDVNLELASDTHRDGFHRNLHRFGNWYH